MTFGSGQLPRSCALISCFGTALLSCHSGEPRAAPAIFPRVRVEHAALGPVDEVVTLTGVLAAAPGRDIKLGALVQGRLARVNVAEGDLVKAGVVLAEIESGPVTDELSQAEATAKEAEAAAQAADAKWTRTEDLRRQGAAAAQDAETARAAAVSARSANARAKAAVDLARRRLTRTAIKAPFDGVVVTVFARGGESVDGNGQPIVEIAAPDPVELRSSASPRQAARLRSQMRATVRVEGLAIEREAEVLGISPAADAATGNILVRVRARNSDGALKLGMLGRASIVVGHLDSAVSVPSSAIVPGPDGGTAVVVAPGGVAGSVPVTIAFTTDGRSVIGSGLDGGEEVITEGGYALPDGAHVEVTR